MLRDRLRARLRDMGPRPDYVALARDVLGLTVPRADLARRLVEQALVVGDRQDSWRRLGEARVPDAPAGPGVYVMRDAGGRALYVGKAKNLRRRLASYFSGGRWRALKPGLPAAASVDWTPAGSDLEAILLEAELIAGLAPAVNVQTSAPRRGLRRRPAASRDVIVVLPSADPDCVELVCARADGGCLRERVRRDGRGLAVATRRVTRFFHGLEVRERAPETVASPARLVYAWLAGPGRDATRLDPRDLLTPRELGRRLEALLADRDLFAERIDQRGGRGAR